MDAQTVDTYTRLALDYAGQWRGQDPPGDMYALLTEYFQRAGNTADIGCGAGRDVDWLTRHGYPTVGYDAAEGLLAQARADYPGIDVAQATLPALAPVPANVFDNVLCETVIMHLPVREIPTACARLVDILKPSGTLYLSWRVTQGQAMRDTAGRLYAAFDADIVRAALTGTDILLDTDALNQSSGKRVHRLVVRRR